MGTSSASAEFLQAYNEHGIVQAIKGHAEYHQALNPDSPIPPSIRAVVDLGVCALRTAILSENFRSSAPRLTSAIDKISEQVLLADDYLPAQNPHPEPSGI